MTMWRCVVVTMAAVIACATAIATAEASQREQICLNGMWKYKAEGTTDAAVPTDGWRSARVPGTAYGHGMINFGVRPEDGASPQTWLARDVFVPATWNDGRRVTLKFLAVDWWHAIYVNGKLIDRSDVMRLCFEVDITSAVKFGQKNEVAVCVKRKDAADVEAGIIRSVYLKCVPKVHVVYSHAIPSVEKMTLTVRTRVMNGDTVARDVTVSPVVLDNGKVVLTLPAKTVNVLPGQSADVETTSPWKDPVLWGFGEYGKPYLYHLRTELSGTSVSDATYDRFGFREFLGKGPKFTLNGKPIFIKGDLISRFWPVTENPNYLVTYYQVMRSANINFQRLHSHTPNNFDSHYWYQTADEIGHLVEAQMGTDPGDSQALAVWTAYINENFNHPSLVMWCPDNESLRPGYSFEWSQAKTRFPKWNTFISAIRKLDPTRIVDLNDGNALFGGVKMGLIDRDNYMTFNMHPYGSLGKELKRAKREVAFDNSVPVIVGEIYPFSGSVDLIEHPMASYSEQKRRGKYIEQAIPDVMRQGASGVVLCALEDIGFLGFASPKECYLGPWSQDIAIRDASKPNQPIVGYRDVQVKVRWPSLSGEGMKCEQIFPCLSVTGAAGGYGFNYNWFDPTRPMFHSNVSDLIVRQAMRRATQSDEPKLGPNRAPEVVVAFGVDGKPVEGAYVKLLPKQGQAAIPAVATDADGTAWFHFWDVGEYVARVEHDGKVFEKAVTITTRPALSDTPGYDYITWVDLGGIDIAKRKAELSQTAEFTEGPTRMAGQMIVGDMEYWEHGIKLPGWQAGGVRESTIVHSGKYAAKVTGDTGQLLMDIRLEAGRKYRLSGWLYKQAGQGKGCIGLRTANWDWAIKLDGSETVGEWTHVQADYVASGAEQYFYCYNYYMGADGVCIYDDLSLTKLEPAKRSEALKPGPFQVGEGGFITHWLVCGPFPNELIVKEGRNHFVGFASDDLKSCGGEAKVQPKYGEACEVTFPDGDVGWIAGKETLTWSDIHTGDIVDLRGLLLPSRGITLPPATNVSAYLACWIDSPTERQAMLAIGSDDCHKVWLNGQCVGQIETERGVAADQNIESVTLKKGRNFLLLKVLQSVGDWKACARFLDDKRNPMTDLTVSLVP